VLIRPVERDDANYANDQETIPRSPVDPGPATLGPSRSPTASSMFYAGHVAASLDGSIPVSSASRRQAASLTTRAQALRVRGRAVPGVPPSFLATWSMLARTSRPELSAQGWPCGLTCHNVVSGGHTPAQTVPRPRNAPTVLFASQGPTRGTLEQ
jgi:hypothetical protein